MRGELQDDRPESGAWAGRRTLPALAMAFITRPRRLCIPGWPDVVACHCRYDAAYYSDALFAALRIDGYSRVTNAVVKRKAEFLAGRYCANAGLRLLGAAPASLPASRGRVPRWPEHTTGSITHTVDTACAAVARAEHAAGLGIDCEPVMTGRRARRLAPTIVNRRERARGQGLPLDFGGYVTLCFSAKESLFKALNPVVKRYFGFAAAEMLDVNLAGGRFTLRLAEDLAPALRRGQRYTGHFSSDERHILTAVRLAPQQAPR